MNNFERVVYDLLKRNPQLKRNVRDIYQCLLDFLPQQANETAFPIKVHEGYFFGFHDKSPWSFDDQLLLGHHYHIPLRMPRPDESVQVGYFDGPEFDRYHVVGETKAWNWHQGAMLQWVGQSHLMIYNDFDGNKHFSTVVNLQGDVEKVLPLPISAISPDGSKALSYSFTRLRVSPYGYSYANGVDPTADQHIPQNEGLSLIDVQSGKTNILFSIAEIAHIEPESTMADAYHYFSHCQFSPSGKQFKFFHRWILNRNQRWTRMFSYNLENNQLHLFPTHEMVSHVAWRDDDHILAYARTKQHGDHYYLFENGTDDFEIIGSDLLTTDGHPSYSVDGRWILTDTYPDPRRMRTLMLYDTRTGTRYDLARLYSPRQFVGRKATDSISCDLHPRWSRKNEMICFDSGHTGQRALCFIQLSEFPDSVISL